MWERNPLKKRWKIPQFYDKSVTDWASSDLESVATL